jgi:protein-disulfide isomerase
MIEQATAVKNPPDGADQSLNFGPQGFTGRYREGPERAVARIVIYSDYQCHQCKRIENEVRAIRAKHPETVSISHKHYPWCAACNKYLNGQTLHGNACWAARAAETAGLLKGNDGFWTMHRWLFDRGGGFTDQELNDGLQQLGHDAKVFIAVMTGEGTLRPVVQDVDEAQALGISGTPMVFINGIELKGWEAPRALERTVEAVLASGAEPATSVNDRPVAAKEKYIADWRDEVALQDVAGKGRHELRNESGHVEVVVFGDYLETNTAKIDAELRAWAGKPTKQGGKPIRYVFRHYPGDKACNTRLPKTFFEHGCLAARVAEAAFVVGGEEGYWKMHTWLLGNQSGFGPGVVAAAATAAGLDPAAVASAMDRAEVQAAIAEDIADATRLRVGQIPCVYVNGKFVKRWTREGDNVMQRIIDEASKQ